MIVILHFRLGQRGLILRTPQHRLETLVDAPTLHELAELPHDRRFVARIHGQIRVLPIAERAQTLKLFALDVAELLGIFPAEPADRRGIEGLLLFAEILQHLMLDRQTMAIPTRHIRHVKARHGFRLDDDVLENLVQGVADMNSAVGIRRTVVEDVAGPPLPGLLDLFVQAFLFPPSQQFGFPLRQVRLHGKIGFGQIKRCFVVHRFGLLCLILIRRLTVDGNLQEEEVGGNLHLASIRHGGT
ncbi:protein of unknown function [Nitrospira japonica]|uniref:Uncharacterized protein n=1 Tax=Nitrospira japonica TaxID=1325564 RepID=A0A1W1I5H1_9BACT|nr:protein of unknown function [Nitrospira japonica]